MINKRGKRDKWIEVIIEENIILDSQKSPPMKMKGFWTEKKTQNLS